MDRPEGNPMADAVDTFFQRWLEASNAGDWDRLGDMMRPEVVLTDPMAAEPAVGRDAVLARARAQYAPFPDGVVTMVGEPLTSVDRRSIAYRWHFTGRQDREVKPPGFAATGRRVELDGASFIELVEGRASRISMFYDSTTVARQLLAAPSAGSPLERLVVVAQRARVAVERARVAVGRARAGRRRS
ncbi:ester cyclase [Egicoccus sp. AB-alg6-2]|uniref:ester cyclase n=1 Tax=Egicoccus sp. AB-alg6-2 TaxID=3242692 RepID=UPI00359D7DA6